MPAGVINVPNDEDGKTFHLPSKMTESNNQYLTEARGSSQRKSVAQEVEGPSLRVRKNGSANYKECSDVDAKVSSTMDDTGYELTGYGSTGSEEDIPSKPSVKQSETSRKPRPQSAKQEPVDAEQQTKTPRVIIKSKKRSGDDNQSELQRSAKRGRKPSAATEITNLEEGLQGILDRYSSKAHEVDSIRSENQDLKAQAKELESKLGKAQQAHKQSAKSLQQENDRLKEENGGLQGEVHELQCEIDRMERENDKLDAEVRKWRSEIISLLDKNKRDSGKYIKVSDSYITEAWMMLSFNVRDLVSQCLTEKPSNQDEILGSLAKSSQLQSPGDIPYYRVSILRKTIWRQLARSVFQGKQPVWQGKLGQFLTQQVSGKDYASIKDPRYLKIISQTKSKAVADLRGEDHINSNAADAQVDNIWEILSPFIQASNAKEFKKRMRGLIVGAVDLHATLMKSKAIFVVKWLREHNGTDSTTFDPTTMETVLGHTGADATNVVVKFVETPGMMKIGNADGDYFEHSKMLCKSVVILEEEEEEEEETTSENDS
ncbi:hypothetical protein CCMA1212_001684 [Trichoderma ghanense]|uniref:Uncharacterized protein n=1 Tax=Trichoderma ghanense TaxID=65468 RepID=A0ABY2HDN3_9HYPO